jgi:hypothetical protein
VSGDPGHPPFLGPAAVAIHDDGDMAGDFAPRPQLFLHLPVFPRRLLWTFSQGMDSRVMISRLLSRRRYDPELKI